MAYNKNGNGELYCEKCLNALCNTCKYNSTKCLTCNDEKLPLINGECLTGGCPDGLNFTMPGHTCQKAYTVNFVVINDPFLLEFNFNFPLDNLVNALDFSDASSANTSSNSINN